MIESTENKLTYVVGESAVFAFPFRFFAPGDIQCFLKNGDSPEETLVRDADFSVEAKTDYATGADITLLRSPLPSGAKFTIMRVLDLTQPLALPEFGKLPSAGMEAVLDKIIMICQQLRETLSRALVVPPTADEARSLEEFLALFDACVTDAVNARNAADDFAAAAQTAKADAVSAKDAAVSAKTDAQTAASAASSYADLAGSAGAYASAASSYADLAVSAGGSAGVYADTASSYAGIAGSAKAQAQQLAQITQGYKNDAEDAAARAVVAGGGMVVVSDVKTVGSAYIPVLSGGTSFRYANPISALEVGSAVDNTYGDCVTLLADPRSITIHPGSCAIAGSAAPGQWNHLTVRDGVASVTPIYHSGIPDQDAHTGVWLVSSNGAAVSSAIVMAGTSVAVGRTLYVYSGGYAINPTPQGSNTVTGVVVSSGGVVYDPQLISCGRVVEVKSGGRLCGGTFCGSSNAGDGNAVHAVLAVSSGGVASDVKMHLWGAAYVSSGGQMVGPRLVSGGNLSVYSGGNVVFADAEGASLRWGHIDVYGGVVTSTTLGNNGHMVISAGGTMDTEVNSGGKLSVLSDGHAFYTIVNSGGTLNVSSGGEAIMTEVSSGGSLTVYSGGSALHVTSHTGAEITVSDGGYIEYV